MLISHTLPLPPTVRALTYADYYEAYETLVRWDLPCTPLVMPAGPNITQLYDRTCKIDPDDGQGPLGNVHGDPIMAAEPGTPLAASLAQSPNLAGRITRTSIDSGRLYEIIRRIMTYTDENFAHRNHYVRTEHGTHLSSSLMTQIPEPEFRPPGFGVRMLQVGATALYNACTTDDTRTWAPHSRHAPAN